MTFVMPTELLVRRATEADAAAVASVIRQSFRRQVEALGITRDASPGYVGFETARRVRRRMARGDRVWLGCIDDRAVATVSCRLLGVGGAGEVLRLGVLPAFRGCEYGRVLMEVAEGELVGAGVGVVELSIVRQFEGLRRHYAGLGYVGERVERFASLPFEVEFMVKRVGGA